MWESPPGGFHRTCFGGNGRRSLKSAGSRILEISNKQKRTVHAWGERPSMDFFPHTRFLSPSARRRISSSSSRSEFLVCLLRNEHESSSETPRVIGFFPKRTFYPSVKFKNQSTQTGTSIATWRLQWSWMPLAMASVQKLAIIAICLVDKYGSLM